MLTDTEYMSMALKLAIQGRGRVNPNPLAGAVIVKNQKVIGQGFHLTNNPDKVYQLSGFGLEIKERVPIQIPPTDHDMFYLKTKEQRMGHILNY